jgi:hypothetical protein
MFYILRHCQTPVISPMNPVINANKLANNGSGSGSSCHLVVNRLYHQSELHCYSGSRVPFVIHATRSNLSELETLQAILEVSYITMLPWKRINLILNEQPNNCGGNVIFLCICAYYLTCDARGLFFLIFLILIGEGYFCDNKRTAFPSS